jgi:hypothetical protein
MSVPLWGVLGVVLVLIGIPLTFAAPAANYVVGAGIAFLIVAASQWFWNRWGAGQDDSDASPELS